MIGIRLAHYEITSRLGTGGMGEVYQATDSKLGRSVAIKLLPESFRHDSERVARFDREARVLASLNHPNIAAIYGVEESGERKFLVIELVAGETLGERIKRGPIPVEEALKIAVQICEALEAAHENGVVHRDLKPANIKITPDGRVKVLDFGLAKGIAVLNSGTTDLSNSPTMVSLAETYTGAIIGTAAYMSPEQAKGRQVDRRTDIFAFGSVLFEMLTGRRAFDGETFGDVLSAVLREDVDWNLLPIGTPAAIQRLLRRALRKDPRHRLADIRDVRIEIEDAGTEGQAHSRMHSGRGVTEALCMNFTIVLPSRTPLDPVGGQCSAPEISPDGSAVMYKANGGLYVRRLDSFEPKLVPGSLGIMGGAFWSSDSATVVFPVSGQLVKVRLPDGAPQRVMQLLGPTRKGSWSEGGTILLAYRGLVAVSALGGEVRDIELTGLQPGGLLNPDFLPGGEDFLFLFCPSDRTEENGVYLAKLRDGRGGHPTLLLKNPTAARYTPAGEGRILFIRNDNLYSQKLNRVSRKLEGEAELVEKGVASQPAADPYCADFSVARNGAVAWRPGKAAFSQVTIFDRQGNQVGVTGPPGPIRSLFLSPDDAQILAAGGRDWLMDVNQPGRQALPADSHWFGWSRDGSKVLGRSNRGSLVEISANGSREVRDLGPIEIIGIPHDVSADGTHVLSMVALGRGIFVTRLEGTDEERTSRTLVQLEERTCYPHFSPDGQWILYESDGLFVQPYPGPGRRQQVAPLGFYPEWRKDGEEIVYITQDGVMAVSVETTGTGLRFGAPRSLFSGLLLPAGLVMADRPLAVSRDGSRFYWPQPVDQPGANLIHITMGWAK